MEEMVDEVLMLRFQKGDVSGFDEIVQRHKKPLINFFYKFLWDLPLAEDSTQEVFCRLFKARKRYKPQAKFTTFLYRIAKNYLIDWFRKNKREPGIISLNQPLVKENGSSPNLEERIPDKGVGPQRALEKKEVSRTIKQAVLSLSMKQRRVFILCEDRGLTYEEVAKVLRIPVGTVKSRLYKAIRLLRERLKGESYICSVEE